MDEEAGAREIVQHLQKAIKAAQPFFDWLADEAVAASAVKVVNNSHALFARFVRIPVIVSSDSGRNVSTDSGRS